MIRLYMPAVCVQAASTVDQALLGLKGGSYTVSSSSGPVALGPLKGVSGSLKGLWG